MKIATARRSLLIGLVLCCLLLAAPALPARSSPALGPDALSITLVAPAYTIETDAQGFQSIRLEGFGDDLTPGHFLLPLQNRHYALPPDVVPGSLELALGLAQTETLPGVYRFRTAAEAQPDCSGAETACSVASVQAANVPGVSAPLARIAGQGQMRKWQIVDIEFAPFQFDPLTGRLSLVRQLTVQVRYRRDPARLDPLLMQDNGLDLAAGELLANHAAATGWYEAAADLTAADFNPQVRPDGAWTGAGTCMSGTCDYVIITTNEIEDNAQNLDAFITSKENHGYSVWVVTEDIYDSYIGQAPNTRADRIRAFLKANYLSFGIDYVLLIGDPDPVDPGNAQDVIGDVPMKMTYPRLHTIKYPEWKDAPTDFYYSDLSGNWDLNGDKLYAAWPEDAFSGGVDWFPEVHVGRIPSYISDGDRFGHLNEVILKLIEYENRIFSLNAWQDTSVLLPMSFGAPGYDGAPLAEELKASLPTYGFTNLYTMYQQANGVCKPDSAYASSQELLGGTLVRNRWYTNHFGMVVWWGHGNSRGASVGYHDDAAKVDCWDGEIMSSNLTTGLNDNYPSFVFMNSCLNGTPEDDFNLGYANLLNGAISTVSASRVSWFHKDQHGNFANGNTNASIAYRYAYHLARSWVSSVALWAAKTDGPTPDSREMYANRLVFNLYGDPAMQLAHGTTPLNATPGWPGDLVISQNTVPNVWDMAWGDYTGLEIGFMLQRRTTLTDFITTDFFSARSIRGRSFKPNFCGEKVYYRIVAYNKWGESSSAEVSRDTRPCQPWDTAVSIATNGVEVSWKKGNGTVETGYRVWRRLIGSADMLQVSGDLPKTQLSYVDSSAACGTSYKYWVQAINASGESDFSSAAGATTNPCPPAPPSNVHLDSATQTTISLGWNDNSSTETNFTPYRATSSSGPWTQLPGQPANSTSYTDPGPLNCGSGYYYQVEAQIKYGKGTSPVSPKMMTLACGKPAAPSNLAASADNSSDLRHVYLSWNDQSSDEMGFKIWRSDDNGPWTLIGSSGPNTTAFRDPGACSTTPRQYKITAYNTISSDASNIAEATLANCYLYNLSANASAIKGSAVRLKWQDQDDPEASTEYFQIYYSGSPNLSDSWVLLADNLPPESRSYDHTELPCEEGAAYLVRAVGRSASGAPLAYTSELNVTMPLPCAPASPGFLPPRANTLDLYWKDQSEFETGFEIEKFNPAQSRTWVPAEAEPAGENLYRVTGLTCGSGYDFRARTYSGDGAARLYSDYSATFHVTTLDCPVSAPTTLTVTQVTERGIGLSWSDAGDNESGYRLWRSAGGSYVEAGTTITNVVSYQDSNVACGSDYRYYVTAENNSGESGASNVVATGALPCVPGSPGVTWAGADQARVNWQDTSSNEITFTVQTSTGPGFSGEDSVFSYPGAANSTRLSVPAAGCGVPRYFRVFAANGWGQSAASDSVALTSLCPPPAPDSLQARSVGVFDMMLVWQHSGADISGFEVLASFDGSSDWHTLAWVDSDTRNLAIGGLFPGSRVYLRVRAYQEGGPSADSELLIVDLKSALFLPLTRR